MCYGMTTDVAAHSASGFPVHVRYRRKGEQGTTAFKLMMKSLFKYEDEGSAPNLSGKVEIVADRGYWGRDMLRYLLSKGADLLGTVKRLLWFKYTWGKKGSATSAKSNKMPEKIQWRVSHGGIKVRPSII